MPQKNRKPLVSNKQRQQITAAVKKAVVAARPHVKRAVKGAISHHAPRLGARAAVYAHMDPMMGMRAGNAIAAHVNRLIGSGDYTIGKPATNSLIKGAAGSAPSFDPRKARITHREYIGDIFTSGTVGGFNVSQFVCNPSDAATFPYISNIAALYEKYRFHGLVMEFVSTVGQYTAGALGSVIMTSAFNTSTAQFINKAQMENMEHAISFRTDQNGLYGVECKDQVQNWFYTKHLNATASPNSNVANIYDLADFSIATYGGSIPANTNIGELWVSVDVEFEGPRLPDQRAAYLHAYTTGGTNAKPFSGHTLIKFGTLSAATFTNSILSLNNVIVGDTFMVTYTAKGSLSETPSITAVGATVEQVYNGFTESGEGAAGTTAISTIVVTLTAKYATLTFTLTGGAETGVGSDLFITPIAFGVGTTYL